MDAARLKEILRQQYGINSEDEFETAVKESKGLNIGIFSTPLIERSCDEQEAEKKDVA